MFEDTRYGEWFERGWGQAWASGDAGSAFSNCDLFTAPAGATAYRPNDPPGEGLFGRSMYAPYSSRFWGKAFNDQKGYWGYPNPFDPSKGSSSVCMDSLEAQEKKCTQHNFDEEGNWMMDYPWTQCLADTDCGLSRKDCLLKSTSSGSISNFAKASKGKTHQLLVDLMGDANKAECSVGSTATQDGTYLKSREAAKRNTQTWDTWCSKQEEQAFKCLETPENPGGSCYDRNTCK